MSVIYGEPGAGKSFLALDIAHRVARGEPWAGCRVAGGSVFYITGEGGRGFVNRVAALAGGASDRLVFLPVAVDLYGAPVDTAALVSEEAGHYGEPALVVIDTLARAMGGGDENAAPDMGAFVRSVDALRDATSAHVMVIHHCGKDRARGARGHSSLKGAVDTEIELEKDGNVIFATASKQKDMPEGRRFAYRLHQVDLGHDQDGDAVTTCVVEPVDVPEGAGQRGKKQPLTDIQATVLDVLGIFIDDHGAPNPGGTGWPEPATVRTVDEAEFKRFAKGKMHHDQSREKARAVHKALQALQSAGHRRVAANEGRI